MSRCGKCCNKPVCKRREFLTSLSEILDVSCIIRGCSMYAGKVPGRVPSAKIGAPKVRRASR
jgi:hypothetical protein